MFDVVRAFTKEPTSPRRKLVSHIDAFFHLALIKKRKTDAFRSKRCGGVGQAQSLVHAQIIPRSLPGKASTACLVASTVNMAHAGARVGMHQHGETKP